MASTVWKGQLAFGLVSVPVRIIRAGRQEKVQFKRVYQTARPDPVDDIESDPPDRTVSVSTEEPLAVTPVRHEYVTQDDAGQKLTEPEVLRAVEYSKGEFAVFRPDEVKRFRAETSSEMEILQFVKTESVDPVYLNASYYVLPDKSGDKAYALLYTAMRQSGTSAMAYVAMHGRKQLLLLRSGEKGIVMHTMFFENEVHRSEEFQADPNVVTPKELKLAELLVAQLEAEFDPAQFKDERLESMRAAVAAKMGSPAVAQPKIDKPVVDILDALKKSLAKKSPGRASAPRKSLLGRVG